MHREYTVTSPSLSGVLSHDALMYEGVKQPVEILRALDSPAGRSMTPKPDQEKVLEQYFYDLYGVFMKRLSQFVLGTQALESETVKLQAMLMEMVKIKKLMSR